MSRGNLYKVVVTIVVKKYYKTETVHDINDNARVKVSVVNNRNAPSV